MVINQVERISLALKVLVLVPGYPYPPHQGFNVRVWHLYRRLAAGIQVTLVCADGEPAPVPAPVPVASSGLRIIGPQRELIQPLPLLIKKLAHLFGPYPVWSAALRSAATDRLLYRLEAENHYDAVILESSWMGVYWPVVKHFRGRKILDLHDLEGEKIARQAALMKAGPEKLKCLYNAWQFRRFERILMGWMDQVWVPSPREAARLRAAVPRGVIRVVPNGVDCAGIQPLPPAEKAHELLFVGHLGYFPNREGLKFFVQEVLPRVREAFPDTTLSIVGTGASREIRALAGRPGVRVIGEVDALKPFYQHCAAAVVPVRAGSGTRLKILEAMAYGRPVVTTTLGCEGIPGVAGRHLLVADDPAAFAAALMALFRRPELARELAQNGRRLVEQHFAWDAIAQQALEYLQSTGR